jgi:DNA-binding transcriptional MerR regulator
MTTNELCESAGLSRLQVQMWLESGFLEAEKVGIRGGGYRRLFASGQLERARLLKALLRKGVSLARLVAADLSFDTGQAYVVYDGHELRACRDATAAIAAVVRAKRPCSAVDLSAIRTATAE